MIPPGRPMDRETLAQAIAAVRNEWRSRCGDVGFARGVEAAVVALEQLRDAATRGEDERDSLVMVAKAQRAHCVALLRRALEVKHVLPLTAHECVRILENAPLADAVPEAPIPAPVGGQTPPTYDYEPFIPADECFTADMLRKVAGHLESGLLTFTDNTINTPKWIAELRVRADRLDAEARRVGGQTPTEPPRRIECDYLCSLCGDMHPLAMDCPIASLRATAPTPPGAPAPFTREDIERMVNIVSNMLGEMEHHDNGSLILVRDMLIAYAKTVPTEGRQETR